MADKPALDTTLQNRGQSHGDFSNMARCNQRLKAVVREEMALREARGQHRLNDMAIESIEMIIVKLGRIITGNPEEPDHWLDIEGYARITRERIKK